MTTVRAFDPYERSKRLHPSAQPAPEPEELDELDELDATILPFRPRAERTDTVRAEAAR